MELIKALEEASCKSIPYKIGKRRQGDIAMVYADPSEANNKLGWKAVKTLKDMCEDAWRWQKNNPTGFM